MATQAQLIDSLRSGLSNIDDGLFTIPGSGRVMGFVASPDFENSTHKQRQEKLWEILRGSFTATQLNNVGPITTMTPEEATLHVVDD